jgi:flagellar biosynthesis protein FlhG
VNNRVKTDEAARLLGLEPARFRFLELQCENYLSQFRWEIPRRYSKEDLKVLAAGNRLLEKGLPPSTIKTELAAMLPGPNGLDSTRRCLSGARLIAVTSGKGGVGKSNIALNLGVELVRSGYRTMLMDADLGVANVHLLAGLKAGPTLRDVVAGKCTLKDIIVSVPGGPDIVPGSSGILELADLPAMKRQALLEELRATETRYDVIIVDTAAGVAGTVLDFVAAADFVLVVTTAEATAITDAYALMKLSVARNPYCNMGIVANRVRKAQEGESAMNRIIECAQHFLGRTVLDLCCIWEDTHVRHAVNERVPFLLSYPKSRASASIRKLARRLQEKDVVSRRRTHVDEAILSNVSAIVRKPIPVSAE